MPRRPPNAEQLEIAVEASLLVDRVRSVLRAKAEKAGQRTLEQKTGHGRGYLSHLFAGTIKNLTLQQVFELLLALDISIAGFFAEVLGAGAPIAGLSREELFGLVDAYMERRSAVRPKPAKAKKPKGPVKNGKK